MLFSPAGEKHAAVSRPGGMRGAFELIYYNTYVYSGSNSPAGRPAVRAAY